MEDFLWFDKDKCELHQSQINSYGNGVVSRLLESFSKLEDETEIYKNNLLEKTNFDPNIDPYEVAQWVEDKSISHFQGLIEVRDTLFAFAVVGLYHLWEKQVIGFLKFEISHVNITPKIERWDCIKSNFVNYGIDLKTFPYYEKLNELRLISNAIKHGEGRSLNDLMDLYPNYFKIKPDCFVLPTGDYQLGPEIFFHISDFRKFTDAISSFWNFDYWKQKNERFKKTEK